MQAEIYNYRVVTERENELFSGGLNMGTYGEDGLTCFTKFYAVELNLQSHWESPLLRCVKF